MIKRKEALQKTNDFLEKYRDEIEHFLKELIEIPSMNTGMRDQGEEHEVQKWLKRQFQKASFHKIDLWTVDSKNKRPNLVGTIKGRGRGKALILQGHCDVVPVHEMDEKLWNSPPWKAYVKDGLVYGRGSSDDKGGLTAIYWAARSLVESGIPLRGDLYIESVIGEESKQGQDIGASATVDRGYRAPFAIIVEPTNCEVQIESLSVFVFELSIQGKPFHACARDRVIFPKRFGITSGEEVGVDAISKGFKFIRLFQELEKEWNAGWKGKIQDMGGYPLNRNGRGDGIFLINPSFFQGGTYIASIPSECKILCVVSHPNWIETKKVKSKILQAIDRIVQKDRWLKDHPPQFDFSEAREWKASKVPQNHPGVRMLGKVFEEVTGNPPIYSGFRAASDATFMADKGIPTVLFGPGDISRGIHGVDECVPIEQVITCAKAYAAMTINWCGLA